MHFVRAIGKAQCACLGVGKGEREVVTHAAAAVRLHGPVDHVAGHGGCHHLDHGDFGACDLVSGGVHQPRGLEREQAGHVDLAARLGNALLRHALLRHRLAKGHARHGALAHEFQCALCQADQAHAVVDASGAKAPLCDFEATAFAQQDVGGWNAHVLEQHLGVAVGCVVVAEHIKCTHDLHAGCVGGHEDHALLRVAWGVRVGLAHGDEHRATRVHGTRCPPFAAVDDVFVPLALDAGGDVGGIARSHVGFGHGEG